jgi:hypothetical protein
MIRRQLGRHLCEFQGLQWKFVDMALKLDAAQMLLYRAASVETGLPSPNHTALAKLAGNQAGFDVLAAGGIYTEIYRDAACSLPVDLNTAHDMIEDLVVSRTFRGYRNKPRGDMEASKLATNPPLSPSLTPRLIPGHPSRGRRRRRGSRAGSTRMR